MIFLSEKRKDTGTDRPPQMSRIIRQVSVAAATSTLPYHLTTPTIPTRFGSLALV